MLPSSNLTALRYLSCTEEEVEGHGEIYSPSQAQCMIPRAEATALTLKSSLDYLPSKCQLSQAFGEDTVTQAPPSRYLKEGGEREAKEMTSTGILAEVRGGCWHAFSGRSANKYPLGMC